jgi:ribose/xylose/arabinose/galactoside ABC-type transport system permease subunit
MSGIPVTAVLVGLFAVLGLLAGLAGLIYTAQYSIRADAGAGVLITAVAIVVLGGTDIFGGRGSVLGVVLAFVLICLLRNGMQLANINTHAQDIVVAGLMIGAIATSRLRYGGLRQSLAELRRRVDLHARSAPDTN